MAKLKQTKSTSSSHLQARVSYLYQVVNLLANNANKKHKDQVLKPTEVSKQPSSHVNDYARREPSFPCNASSQHHLISQLRSVSLKGQVRLSTGLKRTICKRCGSLLITGSTSSEKLENKSRQAKKSWADVLVITCLICGLEKRFPVGATRQSRRHMREAHSVKEEV